MFNQCGDIFSVWALLGEVHCDSFVEAAVHCGSKEAGVNGNASGVTTSIVQSIDLGTALGH